MWGSVYVAIGGIDPEPNRHVRASKSDFTRLKWVRNPSVRRKLPCATLPCQDFCTASTLRGSAKLNSENSTRAPFSGSPHAVPPLPSTWSTTEVPAVHPFCHAASA